MKLPYRHNPLIIKQLNKIVKVQVVRKIIALFCIFVSVSVRLCQDGDKFIGILPKKLQRMSLQGVWCFIASWSFPSDREANNIYYDPAIDVIPTVVSIEHFIDA